MRLIMVSIVVLFGFAICIPSYSQNEAAEVAAGKELSKCLLTNVKNNKSYTSLDGGKSSVTLLKKDCTNDFVSYYKACKARAYSEDECLAKAAVLAQSALILQNR